jgi:outer membrane biosynthesis protein TonB
MGGVLVLMVFYTFLFYNNSFAIEPTNQKGFERAIRDQQTSQKVNYRKSGYYGLSGQKDSIDVISSQFVNSKEKNKSKKEIPSWLQNIKSDKKESESDSLKTPKDDCRSPAKVSKIMTKHSQEIKDCYHDYLKLKPDLTGSMILRIFINPKGCVHDVKIVNTTISDQTFKNKVLEIVKTWQDFGQTDYKKINIYKQKYIFGEQTVER